MCVDVPRERRPSTAGFVSLPHMLIIYNHYYSSGGHYESMVLLQDYEDMEETDRDWEPTPPTVYTFKDKTFLGHVVQGHRVFLFLKVPRHSTQPESTSVFYIDTLTKETAMCYYRSPNARDYIGPFASTGLPVVCFDGLFHEFPKASMSFLKSACEIQA